MAAPVFQAAGAQASGTGAISVAWPSHVSGDVGLLVVEHSGSDTTTAAPSGWTELPGSPLVDVASTAGSKLRVYWQRATSGAMANASVADATDHQVARIFTFRGCISAGNPFEQVGTATSAASFTVNFPALTGLEGDNLLVWIASRPNDTTSTTTFDTFACAQATGVAEAGEAGANAGNGGGFVVGYGTFAGPGDVSAATVNKTLELTHAAFTVALRPPHAFEASANAVGARSVITPSGSAAGFAIEIASNFFVPSSSGGALYSPDGVNWTSISSYPGTSFTTYGGGIAVNLATTTARYSTDPFAPTSSWTSVSITSSASWDRAVYGNGCFVASENVTASHKILRSPDGMSWSHVATVPGNGGGSVCYANGVFAVLRGTSYSVSSDGITWSQPSLPVTPTTSSRVFSAGGFFFYAQADSVLYRSSDGANWSLTDYSGTRPYDVGFCSGVYLLTRAIGAAPLYTSSNGLNWSELSSPDSLGTARPARVAATPAGFLVSVDNLTQRIRVPVGGVRASATLTDAVPTSEPLGTATASCVATALSASMSNVNATFAASVSATSTASVTLSSEGAKLEAGQYVETTVQQTLPAAGLYLPAAFGNGIYVTLANGSSQALISTNGTTWTPTTHNLSNAANRQYGTLLFAKGVFVLTSNNNGGSREDVFTSTDGVTWTQRLQLETTNQTYARWNRGAGSDAGIILVLQAGQRFTRAYAHSTDGTTWTMRTAAGSDLYYLSDVAYGNGYWLLTTNSSGDTDVNPPVYRSSNGVDWTACPWASQHTVEGGAGRLSGVDTITFGAGRFVMTWNTTVVVTTNGSSFYTKWNALAAPEFPIGSPVYDVASDGSTFAAVFYNAFQGQVDYFAVSRDGLNWKRKSLGSFDERRFIGFAADKYQIPSASSTTSYTTSSVLVVNSGEATATGTLTNADPNMVPSSTVVVSTATAALTVGARFQASVQSAVTSSAGLTAQIRLASSVAGVTSVTAVLTAPILLSASSTAATTASASLTVGARMSASVSALVSPSASLTTAIRPAATVAASATTSGSLTTAIWLQASTTSEVNQVLASLNTGIVLTGTGAALSSTSAELAVQTRFAASALSAATSSASLGGASAALSASVGASVASSAILDTQIEFASSAAATAQVSATLTVGALLLASVASSASATAALQSGVTFAASASSETTLSASLQTSILLTASTTAQTNQVLASLNTGIPMLAQAAAVVAASSALTTAIRLESSVAVSASAAASMALGSAELGSSVQVEAFAQAALTTGVRLSAASAMAANAAASLSTAIRLEASAGAQVNNTIAQLSTGETIAGTALASTSVQIASLSAGIRFAGQLQASASAQAELTSGAALGALPECSSSAAGSLTTSIALGSITTCSAEVDASIRVGVLLASEVQASAVVAAELETATRFSSLADVAAVAYADLATEILFAAEGMAQAELQGLLTSALTNLGQSGFRVVVPAELRRVSVAANDNVLVVPTDVRSVAVPAQENTAVVSADMRAMTVSTD